MTENELLKINLQKALSELYRIANSGVLCDDETDRLYDEIERIEKKQNGENTQYMSLTFEIEQQKNKKLQYSKEYIVKVKKNGKCIMDCSMMAENKKDAKRLANRLFVQRLFDQNDKKIKL